MESHLTCTMHSVSFLRDHNHGQMLTLNEHCRSRDCPCYLSWLLRRSCSSLCVLFMPYQSRPFWTRFLDAFPTQNPFYPLVVPLTVFSGLSLTALSSSSRPHDLSIQAYHCLASFLVCCRSMPLPSRLDRPEPEPHPRLFLAFSCFPLRPTALVLVHPAGAVTFPTARVVGSPVGAHAGSRRMLHFFVLSSVSVMMIVAFFFLQKNNTRDEYSRMKRTCRNTWSVLFYRTHVSPRTKII